MSQKPIRLDSKATLLRSGESSGRILSPFSEINANGDFSACFASFKSNRQMSALETDCSYTKALLPLAGIEGQFASPSGPGTGVGVEPVAETLHKPVVAARLEEKIISLLSAVHVGGPIIGRLSNVRRLA